MATRSQSKSSSAPKVAPVRLNRDGSIHALSSDGITRYVVRLGDSPSCSCKGFEYYGYCYHLATAQVRFGAFYSAPWAVIVPSTEPEPPTPAASAIAHTKVCLLYEDPDCPACGSRLAA